MLVRVEAGKGRQGSLCDAVAPASRYPAILMLAKPWSKPRYWLFPGRDATKPIDVTILHAACRCAVEVAGLDKGVTPTCAASLLRHPPPGGRHGYPHHPNRSSGPRQSVDDHALHAGLHANHRQDAEFARRIGCRGHPARLRRAMSEPIELAVGYLLPPWRGFSPKSRLPFGLWRTPRHGLARCGVPHGGAWRSCRTV